MRQDPSHTLIRTYQQITPTGDSERVHRDTAVVQVSMGKVWNESDDRTHVQVD